METQTLAITIVIAIIIAVISEVAKKMVKLDAQQIHLLNLILGVVGGVASMQIFGGDFASNIFMGLTGAVTAPGIYELTTKLFKFEIGGATK